MNIYVQLIGKKYNVFIFFNVAVKGIKYPHQQFIYACLFIITLAINNPFTVIYRGENT